MPRIGQYLDSNSYRPIHTQSLYHPRLPLVHIIVFLRIYWPLMENVTLPIRYCLFITLSAFFVFRVDSYGHLATFFERFKRRVSGSTARPSR
jgi:hypothetical protein